MKTSENIDLISKAISLAQGEMNPASKTTVNPFFKSTFATLTQVWDAIREPLSKNSISIFQDAITTEHGVAVSTRICHASGQWIEFGPLEITLAKKDAQTLGSAITYAKRYALCAAIGVVADDDDDDGEKAVGRTSKPEPIKESSADIKKMVTEYIKEFADVPLELALEFFKRYSEHFKKTVAESIADHQDKDKFLDTFGKWREKNGK